jgi:long-chain fatty acid transport protein
MSTRIERWRRIALCGLFAAGPLFSAAPAGAAGFAIFEQGAKAMGFAGAFTAQADDPTAIFHNVAGIGFLKGTQAAFGGTLIHPSTTFEGSNPFPGSTVTEKGDAGILPPPHGYLTHQFTERLVLGVGVNVPFGLKTQWANPETYSGRFISQKAELRGFSINPSVAYRVADRLSVGGGLDLRLSKVTLERRVPVINPFTFRAVDAADVSLTSGYEKGFGFNLGVLAKPSESLSVGAQYRHKVTIDYAGSAAFTPVPTGNAQLDQRVAAAIPSGSQAVATSISFPAVVTTGVAYVWGDWTFAGDIDWYQWSSFDHIVLDFEQRNDLDQTIEEQWSNSLQFRVGAERRVNDRLAVRGGYFFDKTPSPTESVTPLLPDADRNGIALGATFGSPRLHLDAATWYVFSPARDTLGLNREDYNGVYKSRALTLGLTVGYVF